MSKIKKKLLLALMLVAILPILLLGSYSLYSFYKHLHESTLSTLDGTTSLTSERIETFLENISSDIFYLRDSSAIQLYLSAINSNEERSKNLLRKNVELSFREFVDKKKVFHQARFINTSGMEIVRIDFEDAKAHVISSGKLQNKKGRYYFDDTIDLPKDELMISPLDLNHEGSKIERPIRPTIRYATPVFDKNDKLQGIVVLNILADKMLTLVADGGQGNGVQMFVDPEGYYFYHPDESKTWGSKHDLDTGVNLFIDNPDVKSILNQDKESGNSEVKKDVISFRKISLGQKQHPIGTLITLAPKSLVFSPLTTFFWVFGGIVLLALLLTFALATLLSNSISSPLVKLKEEVERLAKGDIDTPIDIETTDEIGEVSQSIERLRRSMEILMKRG